MASTIQSIDELVAALDGMELGKFNLSELQERLKAQEGELPSFDIAFCDTAPGSRSHEINIESPAIRLLPTGKRPFLPPPKQIRHREEPEIGEYGMRLDRLQYIVRTPTTTQVRNTPVPYAVPDLPMLEYIERLQTHPGVSNFQMVAFEHDGHIHRKYCITTILFAQSDHGVWRSAPEVRNFTFDHNEWSSTFKNVQAGTFASHVEHVENRGCDTSYLIAQQKLRTIDPKVTDKAEKKMSKLWGVELVSPLSFRGRKRPVLPLMPGLSNLRRKDMKKDEEIKIPEAVRMFRSRIVVLLERKEDDETGFIELLCNHINPITRQAMSSEAIVLEYTCTICGHKVLGQESKADLDWLWKQKEDREMRTQELKFFEDLSTKGPADLPSTFQVPSKLVKKELIHSLSVVLPGPSLLHGQNQGQPDWETSLVKGYFVSDGHCKAESMQVVLEDDVTLGTWIEKAHALLKLALGVEDDDAVEAALPPFYFETLYRWFLFTILKLASRYQFGDLEDEQKDEDYEPSESEEQSETGSEAESDEEMEDDDDNDNNEEDVRDSANDSDEDSDDDDGKESAMNMMRNMMDWY